MTSETARRRFLEIVAPSLDDAYSLAKWLSGSGADAEDIVQDAAMRALQALESAHVDKPRAWFLTITRNAAMSWMARNRPKALSFVGDLADLEGWEDAFATDPPDNPEQALMDAQRDAEVRGAVAALPLPWKETVVMRDIHGLSYRDIAAATQTPIGTVMSRLARARAALAKSMGGRR